MKAQNESTRHLNVFYDLFSVAEFQLKINIGSNPDTDTPGKQTSTCHSRFSIFKPSATVQTTEMYQFRILIELNGHDDKITMNQSLMKDDKVVDNACDYLKIPSDHDGFMRFDNANPQCRYCTENKIINQTKHRYLHLFK